MNFNDLKATWKQYDASLAATRAINERMIHSMIRNRSSERFERAKRKYLLSIAWMIVCFLFGVAALVGNPFDFTMPIQYVPIGIFTTCLAILTVILAISLVKLQSVSIEHHNVQDALKEIISVYEKPNRFGRYVVILFLFTQVVLFPLSFLPRTIERMGLWPALLERFIPITISVGLLFLAHKLGLFRQPDKKLFKNDLQELNELKALSKDLSGF